MKKTILKTCCFLFLICWSCGNEKASKSTVLAKETIEINPDKASSREVLYTQVFSKIQYLPIHTDDNFIIGSIDKLLVTDDYLFIMDRRISHSVFCIDKKGSKVFSIKKQGKGPGEYVAMKDIAYKANEKELIIYCKMRKKLIYYNMQGNFLREEKMPFSLDRVEPINEKFALYRGYSFDKKAKKKDVANLLLASRENNNVYSEDAYFKAPITFSIVWSSECQFSLLGDTLAIKPDHSDIVYHITEKKIEPAYLLDFGKYAVDEGYWKKTKEKGITSEAVSDYCNNRKLCESFRFLEGKSYIYFVYRRNQKAYHALYSKETKQLLQIENFKNNMDGITAFHPIAIHRDKLYCLLNSENVYNLKKTHFLNGILPQSIIDSVQEFDNQLIAVFSLKKF